MKFILLISTFFICSALYSNEEADTPKETIERWLSYFNENTVDKYVEEALLPEKIKEINTSPLTPASLAGTAGRPLLEQERGETVIIYRSNREAFPMALALSKVGLPFSIESDEDLLGDKYVKKLLIILEALHNFGDDLYMAPLLHIEELGIEPQFCYALMI